MVKQAVILAAGGGGRIRPFTVNRPKSMICLAGKPMIQLVIEALRENGIRDIILIVGHHKERIFDFLASGYDFNVSISYVTQASQLGSADALLKARDNVDDDFIVLPGNKYIRPETITPIIGADAPALLVKQVADPPRSSIVTMGSDGMAKASLFKRKNDADYIEKGTFEVDTRVYRFNKDIFDYLEGESSIKSALNKMAAKNLPVKTVRTKGEWADLIYPWDILAVNALVLKNVQPNTSGVISSYVLLRGDINIGKQCTIHSNCNINGPVVINNSCTIHSHVSITGPISIGENTTVEPFTFISNSVIGSNVHIAAGSIIIDSVIDDGTFIGPRFTTAYGTTADVKIGGIFHDVSFGAMIGEGCQLGANITTQPGTVIGNYCSIKDLKVLSGTIPDKSMVF
jgi:glucose-1-phosphate thymidylyltransferase